VRIDGKEHWENIRDRIPEGSLFFTRGPGIISHFIACRSPVSHVGILLRYGDRVFGLDSTIQKGRAGVDLFNFSSLINPKRGEVYILPLSHPKEKLACFHRLAKEFCHTPYEKKRHRLARFYFGMRPPDSEDSLFCSELVVQMLNQAYSRRYNASAYHPKHLFYMAPPISNLLYQLHDDANQFRKCES
jgi:hypothetical protein